MTYIISNGLKTGINYLHLRSIENLDKCILNCVNIILCQAYLKRGFSLKIWPLCSEFNLSQGTPYLNLGGGGYVIVAPPPVFLMTFEGQVRKLSDKSCLGAGEANLMARP